MILYLGPFRKQTNWLKSTFGVVRFGIRVLSAPSTRFLIPHASVRTEQPSE